MYSNNCHARLVCTTKFFLINPKIIKYLLSLKLPDLGVRCLPKAAVDEEEFCPAIDVSLEPEFPLSLSN